MRFTHDVKAFHVDGICGFGETLFLPRRMNDRFCRTEEIHNFRSTLSCHLDQMILTLDHRTTRFFFYRFRHKDRAHAMFFL